jgi:hypothetical protein
VEITVSRPAESRRLASFSVGLDMTAKIVHRIPPPIFWTQIPCFLWFTGVVAPQNRENKGVPCKIVQDKELRGCFEGISKDYCAVEERNNLQGTGRPGGDASRMGFVVSHPFRKEREMDGAPCEGRGTACCVGNGGSILACMIRCIVLLGLITLPTLASGQSFMPESATSPTVVIADLSPLSYPPLARAAHVWGDVIVLVNLRRDGFADSATVLSGPQMLRQVALESALKTRLKCDDCAGSPATSQIVYKFELGEAIYCSQSVEPSKDGKPERPYPQLTYTSNVVNVYDRPFGTCDYAADIESTRTRSIRCLFLWKCGWH